nr:HAMP domain-containing sensor histidine kinase [uncultured Cohaesibacter sp.]
MKLFSEALVSKLARRFILVQFVSLFIVAGGILFLLPNPDVRTFVLDKDILLQISKCIDIQDDKLTCHADEKLAAVMNDYPNFWFYARNEPGNYMQYGPIPKKVSSFIGKIPEVTYANLSWRDASPKHSLIALKIPTASGIIAVASGGGPFYDPMESRTTKLNRFFVSLLTLMAVLTALITPILLRNELKGVARVAEEATHIDVDRRGSRLTETDVPLEMQGLVRAVNMALARLDEGLEKRQRFLAAASHELRTPIAILTTRIEVMPDSQIRDRLMLDIARLSSLANQLLDLERLDGDHIRLMRIDLREIVSQVSIDIAPLAIAAGADISLDVPDVPVIIDADLQAIERVVTNLVQNAISYSGEGALVEIEVALPAEIRIRDNGPGIALADRNQIFEPFVRKANGGAGAGLGLNLVKEIMDRHKGSIHVVDSAMGGAEFIVRFPAVASHA